MRKMSRLILIALGVALIGSFAQADELEVVGDATFANYSISGLPSGTTSSTTTHAGYGGGAMVNLYLNPMFSFEVGALYTQKKVDLSLTSGGLTASGSGSGYYLQIPAIFRYWFAPVFSVGVGGFFERGVSGDWSHASPQNDGGLVGAAGFRIPLSDSVKVIAEGRYYWGLTNYATGGEGQYWRDIQALAGFSFGL